MSWYLRQDCHDHDSWPCAVSFANKYCILCSKLAKISMRFNSPYKTSKLLLKFEMEKLSFFAAPSPMLQSTHKWIILCLQDPQTVHQVHHYQITDWPDKGIPKNAQCILDMIIMVEQSQRKTSSAPLVVQCRWRKTELFFIFLLFLNWIYIERFQEGLAISLLCFCGHFFDFLSPFTLC